MVMIILMVAASKHNVESATLRNIARKKTMFFCAVRKRTCAPKNSSMRSFQMTINLEEHTFHLLNDYYICIVMTASSSPVFPPCPISPTPLLHMVLLKVSSH